MSTQGFLFLPFINFAHVYSFARRRDGMLETRCDGQSESFLYRKIREFSVTVSEIFWSRKVGESGMAVNEVFLSSGGKGFSRI